MTYRALLCINISTSQFGIHYFVKKLKMVNKIYTFYSSSHVVSRTRCLFSVLTLPPWSRSFSKYCWTDWKRRWRCRLFNLMTFCDVPHLHAVSRFLRRASACGQLPSSWILPAVVNEGGRSSHLLYLYTIVREIPSFLRYISLLEKSLFLTPV